MALTVLSASPNCLATRRAEALSQASPTASSKRLENGALLGNWSTLLDLQAAVRATHPVQLDHHRGAVLEARQIPHLALCDVGRVGDPAPASRAD